MKILIADDVCADSLAMLCRSWGHETVVAHDGEEAVRRAQESRPELVLLDVRMPGMNGLEACRQIKRSLGVTIIGLSGYASNEEAKLAGMDYFYRKPWDPELLCAMIEDLGKSGNSEQTSANTEVSS